MPTESNLTFKYATFWPRFVAILIDFLVFIPVIWIHWQLTSGSKLIAYFLVLPMALLFSAYSIYCHGKFGQTIGKRVVRIRVTRVSGERIGWREAWLRSSIDLALGVIMSAGMFAALATIPDSEYFGVQFGMRGMNLRKHTPLWLAWQDIAIQVWGWSEIVVMFFNEKRRALHDFMAGTVVIKSHD